MMNRVAALVARGSIPAVADTTGSDQTVREPTAPRLKPNRLRARPVFAREIANADPP